MMKNNEDFPELANRKCLRNFASTLDIMIQFNVFNIVLQRKKTYWHDNKFDCFPNEIAFVFSTHEKSTYHFPTMQDLIVPGKKLKNTLIGQCFEQWIFSAIWWLPQIDQSLSIVQDPFSVEW